MDDKLSNVKIYYDNSTNSCDFYVEICFYSLIKIESSGYSSLSKEQKEALIRTFPEIEKSFDDYRKSNYSDTKGDEIKEYIEKYKGICEATKSFQRFRINKNYKFEDIEKEDMPKQSSLKDCNYSESAFKGSQEKEKIIEFIKEIEKKLKRKCYVVYECSNPQCNQINFLEVKRESDELICSSCKQKLDKNTAIKAKYTSDNCKMPKQQAILKSIELKELQRNKSKFDVNVVFNKRNIFNYNGKNYVDTKLDFEYLHKHLYNDFACEEVFEKNGDNDNFIITFTKNYLNYIECFSNHEKLKVLFEEYKIIQNQINNQSASLHTIEKAFYWYMNKYVLKHINCEKKLVWKIRSKRFKFSSPKEYVEYFINHKEDQKNLLNLYNELTFGKGNFFEQYGKGYSDFSRMIYDYSDHFVYIVDISEENKTIIDFEKEFLNQLYLDDDLKDTRNLFIEEIKKNNNFWNEVKNKYVDYEDYYDENSYCKLCFYQYAINGKKELKYKSLTIENSKEGIQTIKSIILAAYQNTSDYSDARKQFIDLIDLIKRHKTLFEKLNVAVSVVERTLVSNNEEETLDINKIEDMLDLNDKVPSLQLYLICLDITKENRHQIKFRFDNYLDTFEGHLRRICENEKSSSLSYKLNSFYDDHDVQLFLQSVFAYTIDKRFTSFMEEKFAEFTKLNEQINELEKNFK